MGHVQTNWRGVGTLHIEKILCKKSSNVLQHVMALVLSHNNVPGPVGASGSSAVCIGRFLEK